MGVEDEERHVTRVRDPCDAEAREGDAAAAKHHGRAVDSEVAHPNEGLGRGTEVAALPHVLEANIQPREGRDALPHFLAPNPRARADERRLHLPVGKNHSLEVSN